MNPEDKMLDLIERNRDQVDDSMLADVERFVEEFKTKHGFELRMRKPTKIALVKWPLLKIDPFSLCVKGIMILSMVCLLSLKELEKSHSPLTEK